MGPNAFLWLSFPPKVNTLRKLQYILSDRGFEFLWAPIEEKYTVRRELAGRETVGLTLTGSKNSPASDRSYQ
jgi:hypothetical protein